METVDEFVRLNETVQQDIARLTAGKEEFVKTNAEDWERLSECRRDLDRQLAVLAAERKEVEVGTSTQIQALTDTVMTARAALIRRITLASLRDHWPAEFKKADHAWREYDGPVLLSWTLYDDGLFRVWDVIVQNETGARPKNSIDYIVKGAGCVGYARVIERLLGEKLPWGECVTTRYFPDVETAEKFRHRNADRLAADYVAQFAAIREECFGVTESLDDLFDFRLLLDGTFTRNHVHDHRYKILDRAKHRLLVVRLEPFRDCPVGPIIDIRFTAGRFDLTRVDPEDREQILGYLVSEFALYPEGA